MSHLLNEILLRLAKAVVAAALGAILYAVATAQLGVAPSFELALLCWLSGAAFILLVQESPI